MKNVNNEVVEFYKKLGYTLIEIKSSVFREEESTLVFQTDNKNHTVDGSTILYDHAIAIHHQLQKARHDWLREEIVRLEGMLSRWVAAYMPADEGKDPSKWGFKTEKEAWDFIEKRLTPCPLDPRDKSGEPCDSCMAEWMVYQIPEVDQALQTIIDRYHEELDQLTRDDWNEDMERSHTLAELDQDKV